MKKALTQFLPTIVFFSCFAGIVIGENDDNKLFSDIEEYIKAVPSASMELERSIIDQIEASPAVVAKVLIEKLNTSGCSNEASTIYVWAIGFTKDANAVDELIKISSATKSQLIKANACRSLAMIGGNKAAEYLLSEAKKAPEYKNTEGELEKMEKFDFLNLLAEMQYAPALPEMEGLLKLNEKFYWKVFFCFGKMGDKAAPYLLEKIDDPNRNVRLNSIVALQRLLANEAAEPLSKQYWKEKDPLIKNLILGSMERIVPDLKEMEVFFREVVAKEQDKKLKQFADEAVENIDEIKKVVGDFKSKKSDKRELFEAEYKSLYKSAGKEGIFENLGMYSHPEDEPRLKKLRERVLFRNSDECFYDYEEINKIIMFNRFISKNKDIAAEADSFFKKYGLFIDTPSGGLNWDVFVYWPEGNYPDYFYGGSSELIGTWAYVHE